SQRAKAERHANSRGSSALDIILGRIFKPVFPRGFPLVISVGLRVPVENDEYLGKCYAAIIPAQFIREALYVIPRNRDKNSPFTVPPRKCLCAGHVNNCRMVVSEIFHKSGNFSDQF